MFVLTVILGWRFQKAIVDLCDVTEGLIFFATLSNFFISCFNDTFTLVFVYLSTFFLW